MREAVARFVPDGASVCLNTAIEALIPFAAGHELIRQRRRELTLIGPISDMLFDQLVGAGCVRRIVAAWVGNVSAGLGHNYRRARDTTRATTTSTTAAPTRAAPSRGTARGSRSGCGASTTGRVSSTGSAPGPWSRSGSDSPCPPNRWTTAADEPRPRASPSRRDVRMTHTDRELMVIAAGRQIRDADAAFVGLRLPLLPFAFAKRTHAPRAIGFFENGLVRDRPAAETLMT